MEVPENGAPCPECGEGRVRYKSSTLNRAWRFAQCSRCGTTWDRTRSRKKKENQSNWRV